MRGDAGLIPGSGRFPGVGNGNPLQYSCLENSMDRGFGGLQSLGVAKSKTRRSTHTQRTHLQSAQNNSSTATMIYRALYARYTSKVVSSITSQYSLLFPGNWGLERSSHLHRSSWLVSSGARIHTQQSCLLSIIPIGVFKTPKYPTHIT